MKSPYALFVALVAKAVDGEYPAQYSSSLHRELRIVLCGSTALFTAIALYREETILTKRLFEISTLEELVIVGFAIIVVVAIFSIATRRRKSIEKHALNKNMEAISENETSLEVTKDTITLYDYFKVFFALAVLFFIPDILFIVFRDVEIVRIGKYATFPIHMYYFLLVIDSGGVLGGRWAKKYVNNDKSSTNSPKSSDA